MLPHALEQCREQCRGIREGKLKDLARRVHSELLSAPKSLEHTTTVSERHLRLSHD